MTKVTLPWKLELTTVYICLGLLYRMDKNTLFYNYLIFEQIISEIQTTF